MIRLICTVTGCTVTDCKNHYGENGCIFDEVRITGDKLTAGGFLPMCEGYEEKQEIGVMNVRDLIRMIVLS